METPQQSSNARLAAILALIAVFIVLIVVVVTTLGGGGSGKSAAHHGGQSQSKATQKHSARKTYVVKPGDSLSVIADKVGISVEQLQRLNPHIDQFSLQSGDRVKLR